MEDGAIQETTGASLASSKTTVNISFSIGSAAAIVRVFGVEAEKANHFLCRTVDWSLLRQQQGFSAHLPGPRKTEIQIPE